MAVLLLDRMKFRVPKYNACSESWDSNTSVEKKDFSLTSYLNKTKGKPVMLATIDVSYSDTILNRRIYPGVHHRNSTPTWVKDYGRPFLSRHPNHPSPFIGDVDEPTVYGRAYKAEYIRFVDEAVFKDAWKNPGVQDKGSGVVRVQFAISDSSAIEQIVDERIVTVSAGQITPVLLCSICGHDWSKGEPCEHDLMKLHKVEKKGKDVTVLAYLITGPLLADHLANTFKPAHPMAGVIAYEIKNARLRDSLEETFFTDEVREVPIHSIALQDERGVCMLCDEERENTEDVVDARASAIIDKLPEVQYQESIDVAVTVDISSTETDTEAKMDQDPKTDPKVTPKVEPNAEPAKDVKDSVETPKVETKQEPKVEAAKEVTLDAQGFTEAVVLKSIKDAGIGFDYEAVKMTADSATEKIAQLFTVKLTDDQKIRLSDSVYCGPNRSFPVWNSLSAKVSHDYLAYADLPSDKKQVVLDNIYERAHKLGCVAQDSDGKDVIDPTIEGSLIEAPVSPVADSDSQAEIVDLRKKIENLTIANRTKGEENLTLLDENFRLRAELRMTLAQLLVSLRDARRKESETAEAYARRSVESLRDSIRDILAEENAPLVPDAKVDDPTLVRDSGADASKSEPKKEGNDTKGETLADRLAFKKAKE